VALNYVTLTLDMSDVSGAAVKGGNVLLGPSAAVTGGGIVVASATSVPVPATGTPRATVSLLATDNAGLLPAGWSWSFAYLDATGRGVGSLIWSFLLPYSGGAAQNLSACTRAS
jgi:hypothetical protein